MKLILYYIFVSFVSLDNNIAAHPGARTWCHASPWWALRCRYPRGPQQPENKKYLDYDYQDPAEGVEPSQRPCRARDRVLVNGLVVLAVLLAGAA